MFLKNYKMEKKIQKKNTLSLRMKMMLCNSGNSDQCFWPWCWLFELFLFVC